MCGIAGLYSHGDQEAQVDRKVLARMARSLAHRGPDGEGFFVDGPVGLSHRRLAIVDLSLTGAQPMATEARDAWIVYNGELYNHLDFRPLLEAKGVRFRGPSDTETLLYLLRMFGPDALEDCAGIFGLAYWDVRARRLLLARDPVGVKQVYFHDAGRRVAFASEIKALFHVPGVPREADGEALNDYVHFHAPLFRRTFFKGIEQLGQGEYRLFSERGSRSKVYWQLNGFEPSRRKPEETVEELSELLGRVVREQLMSDVPVGAFFSGGIDSTAVASFARKAGKTIRCFGVHFTGQGVIDERPFQEAAAKALELPLDLVTVSGADFPAEMDRLLYQQDQPLIGPAMIPMYHVSKLAGSHVKVCLGGQGADELFGGYARYALAHPARVASGLLRGRSGGGTESLGRPSHVGGNLLRQLADGKVLRRLAASGLSFGGYQRRYFNNFASVPDAIWGSLFRGSSWYSRKRAWGSFREGLVASTAVDPGDKLMHWDQRTYLPGLFAQDDRMSMASSLESRVPIADPRIVRFAAHVPFNQKMTAGASKWVLRKAVAGVIPDWVLNRRKVGFDTPAERWMRTLHRGWLRDLFAAPVSGRLGLVDATAAKRFMEEDDSPDWFQAMWKLTCIEVWTRVFLEQNPAGRIGPDETVTEVPLAP